MNKERIALVTDSSCDLPAEILQQYSIFTLPLKIIYHDREYSDGVDITPDEVYQRFESEIPKTAMTAPADIYQLFNSLKEQGISKVLAIHISSALSGVYELVQMIGREFQDMQIEVVDSKTLSMGLGFMLCEAGRCISQGLHLEEIRDRVLGMKDKVKVFYSIPVLDYLRKGGRIGLVSATIGSILNLKPIISVNEDGRYYSYDKVRGRRQSLERLVEIAADMAQRGKVRIAVMHGAACEEATHVKEVISKLPNIKEVLFGQISPALVVHTGPGLVGIALQLIPDGEA
jgi:DegV family protein with EDD domain